LSYLFLFKKKDKPRSRLPPSQRWINHILKWGEEHRGIQSKLPDISHSEWRLIVDGDVETQIELEWSDFINLEQVESISDFHCVETWSVMDQKWEGVRFSTLIDLVKPSRKAKYVLFQGYDGYTTSLRVSDLIDENIVLAHRLNDEPLPQSLGGPMRLVVPNKYGYKSAMWLNRVTFSSRDKLGYWERGAFSNSGDPWRNDRYSLK
jgi:DMSO/TMAO reductase YedYZ molybdopterin-dependent catalytic subunit